MDIRLSQYMSLKRWLSLPLIKVSGPFVETSCVF